MQGRRNCCFNAVSARPLAGPPITLLLLVDSIDVRMKHVGLIQLGVHRSKENRLVFRSILGMVDSGGGSR